LQCVAVCCSVLQCIAASCSVLQCVAVCCSMLQYAAVCCSALQCICSVLQCIAVCYSVLQCVAVCAFEWLERGVWGGEFSVPKRITYTHHTHNAHMTYIMHTSYIYWATNILDSCSSTISLEWQKQQFKHQANLAFGVKQSTHCAMPSTENLQNDLFICVTGLTHTCSFALKN